MWLKRLLRIGRKRETVYRKRGVENQFAMHNSQCTIKDLLYLLEQHALATDTPIVDKETADFLYRLVAEKKPKHILEIGTAIGYSGIVMLSAVEKTFLTTIDKNPRRIEDAADNFAKAGFADRVEMIFIDAVEFLEKNTQKFDFIFLDAAKMQYPKMLPLLKKAILQGGTVVADNVLNLKHSNFNQKILPKMEEFCDMLKADKDMNTEFLELGDGLSVSIMK